MVKTNPKETLIWGNRIWAIALAFDKYSCNPALPVLEYDTIQAREK